jgi:hypothetical protein
VGLFQAETLPQERILSKPQAARRISPHPSLKFLSDADIAA